MNVPNPLDSDVRNQGIDTLLDQFGLQRKQPKKRAIGGAGIFALGVAVGAGLGMLFAPKSGEQMRQQAGERFPAGGREVRHQEEIYERPR